MKIRSGIKTGILALSLAAAPVKASAQHVVIHDAAKIEQFAEKNVSKLKTSVGLSTHELLGTRVSEPVAKVGYDFMETGVYVRPELSLGKQTYKAVLPVGFRTELGDGVSFELGSDIVGMRGFYNKEHLFQSEVDNVLSGKSSQAISCKKEMFSDIHLGFNFQKNNVNASVRTEVGKSSYMGTSSPNENKGFTEAQIINGNIPKVVPTPRQTYVGARANVEFTPLNNKNAFVVADAAVSTNKGPEVSVGLGYKF